MRSDYLFRAQITLPKHFLTSFMHNVIHELQTWNQLLVICLNSSLRPTWGHSMHPCDQAPRHPPKSNHSTRVPIYWAWAKDFKTIKLFAGSGQEISGDPPQIVWVPPNDHPPTDPSELTHLYIPIDSSQRQGSEYVIYISIDTWRQYFMMLDASWWHSHF